MITDDLYNRILIEPAKNGSDELFIVSGYSSASFLRRHMNEIKKINEKVKINLLIGMHQTRRDHSAYVDLIKSNPKSIEGYYYSGRPGVHSKVYTWIQNKSPREGFSGSANYSQYGFFEISQKNQMMRDDATQIMEYFLKLKTNSVNFLSYTPTEDELVQVENVAGSIPPGESEWIVPNESMRISFLTKNGQIAKKHSLNWGQRPGRNPNEACLPINGDARANAFLPPHNFTFTLLTDDGMTMDCKRQQGGGKAISTTYNNSEIGMYFRKRLNVPLGKFVHTEDLIKYGRTDFVLKKIDDETFYLDFKKP